ncbi:MAG: MarC family protein [Gammaproteobacteria bacterium]|nr:MarC family protein [Gammaproteobacteria bacterium]
MPRTRSDPGGVAVALFLSLWIKLFFVLTPFFGLTMFLSMTEGYDAGRRRRLALAVSLAVAVLCLVLFFAGQQIFSLFGITLDAFRIGAGVLLMLSAIALVQGRTGAADAAREGDVAVVPLAMPIIVGPATTGTLLVLGAELDTLAAKMIGSLALLLAVACVAAILLAGSYIQRCLGVRGISILSKLTGLILAALAAQMIMTGIQGFIGVA